MVCWNPWGYSNERNEYCTPGKQLGYDILGLTELHNEKCKAHFKNTTWIHSEKPEVKDGKSTDPAEGVTMSQ